MIDNIQKLYKIAGVEKKPVYSGSQLYNPVITGYEYPPFTAEKQIEIIKFLIGKYASFGRSKNYEQKDLYMVYYECRYFPKQYLPFEEALAESVNYLWQDLTDDQKQQIKEILQ